MTTPATRVFISYAHESDAHREQVLNLSEKLRGDMIDCHIDQYDEADGPNWPRWMMAQLRSAQFVLVVGSPLYLKRFEGLEEKGKGLGIKWEGAIIAQELYDNQGENSKFIPVVFSRADYDHLPTIIRGHTWYLVDDETGYNKLLARLKGLGRVLKRPLGVKDSVDGQSSSVAQPNTTPSELSAGPSPVSSLPVPRRTRQAQALADGVLKRGTKGAILARKLAVLEKDERAYVVRQFLDRADNEHAFSALAEVLHNPQNYVDPVDVATTVAKAVLIAPDVAMKARFLREFPLSALTSVELVVREAFFAEIIEIMDRDQYVEVNLITPAAVRAQAAMPPSLRSNYVRALLSQAQSGAFQGRPAAENALAHLPPDLADVTLSILDEELLWHADSDGLRVFLLAHAKEWPAPKRTMFQDYIDLEHDDFREKYWKLLPGFGITPG